MASVMRSTDKHKDILLLVLQAFWDFWLIHTTRSNAQHPGLTPRGSYTGLVGLTPEKLLTRGVTTNALHLA
jgi:hypothetical protein